MKKIYLAVVEMSVYGWSFVSADDAEQMALNWWESQGEEPSKIRIMEFQCPDCMTENDFQSCASYHEYQSVIDAKFAELADNASQELLNEI